MTPSTLPSSDFVSDVFRRARPLRAQGLVAVALATAAHVAAAALASGTPAPRLPNAPPMDIEFMAPPPPATEPPPLPAPKESEPVRPSIPTHEAPKAEPKAPPPPAPAAAPPVVTAAPTAANANADLLDFTSDPTATGLGYGVVAVGGKGQAGGRGVAAQIRPVPMPPSAAPAPEAIAALADLGRRPELPVDDPCRGYFPGSALDDRASVSVMLVIGRDGSVGRADVVSESPKSQGFGAAAAACMKHQHFNPGLDRDGKAVKTAMRVNVRFNR
ncbi:MAG TPA: energy transducer TonB [Polyangiaceae bacterium]|nr:energy transducer TonB [Polyangiaceae bacterium]